MKIQDNDIINEYAKSETRGQIEEDPPKKEPGEKDSKLSLLLTQLVVCTLALLAVFLLKLAGGEPYDETRKEYIARFEKRTTVEEVTQTLANVFNAARGTSSDPQTGSSDESAASAGSGASVSSEDSGAQNAGQQDVSSAGEESGGNGTVSQNAESSQTGADSNGSSAGNESEAFLPDLTAKETSVSPQSQKLETLPIKQLSVGSVLRTDSAKLSSSNTMAIPVNGEITSLFGLRSHPVYGEELFHAGADIGADEGTEIYAALAGTVITVNSDSGYGNYVVLSHSNGLKTLYAHCSKIKAAEGDTVKKGQVIALVGNTGVSTGPHLHFEVILNGINLNPLWFL